MDIFAIPPQTHLFTFTFTLVSLSSHVWNPQNSPEIQQAPVIIAHFCTIRGRRLEAYKCFCSALMYLLPPSSSHIDCLCLKPEKDFSPCQVLNGCRRGRERVREREEEAAREGAPSPQSEKKRLLQTYRVTSWHWCRTILLNGVIWPQTHWDTLSTFPKQATTAHSRSLPPPAGVCIRKWPVK